MPDIFISYRRDDTSGYAGRLYDQISAHVGADHVFMDVADIGPGSDFVEVIEKQVGTCDALIALIGKNWLTVKDDQNHSRLGNADDFVSIEILAALKRNIEVIPALVGGAKMPLQRELPGSLQPLARRQAVVISDTNFARDVQDLIAALEKGTGQADLPARTRKYALIAGVLLLVAIAIGAWKWQEWKSRRDGSAASVATGSAAKGEATTAVGKPGTAANTDISGTWKAVLNKDGSTFNAVFTFEVSGDKLFGRAVYPTGEASIQNGTIGNGRISFITRHAPQFADREATITVDGRIAGDEIQILMQYDNGFAKGVARRVSPSSPPG